QLSLEKVHYKLVAADIWAHLEELGFTRRRWFEDTNLLAAVGRTVDRYRLRHTESSIGGYRIERSEASTVLDKLADFDGGNVLVVSEAGGGKSQVLLQTVDKVVERRWPIIAFSVDTLSPTTLEEKVGEQLGLPSSPPRVLASIARDSPSVLVIDQLDAVSLASGRNPEFYEVIREIIAETRIYPNIKVVLACRQFDLENDYRMRRLSEGAEAADVVTVRALELGVVKEVIARLGPDPGDLEEGQLASPENPLHLSLLAEIA